MSIRVVRGFEQARRELARRRLLDLETLPPEFTSRTEELFGKGVTPQGAVERILADVRKQGDTAVRHYTRLLEGVEPEHLEVSREAILGAKERLPAPLLDALRLAASRIEAFHRSSLPRGWLDFQEGLGQLIVPLERVGVYAPGGTASYPSSVLMTAIPAKVAGVREVVLATPSRGELPPPAVLAAAELSGVDRVFALGGAQAIAAMAYGTESVPKVDKICGPGNIFVTLAKKMVYGEVDIDGIYGPTETLLIADDSASAAFCAADLLAQAEHDPLASPVLVTTSPRLLEEVERELERQVASLERRDVAQAALKGQGCLVLVESLEEAMELANLFAPEHLCLIVREPWIWAGRVRNAGGVFLGEFSPEVMGDYVAGPSHTMPTGGTARFKAALGVHDFIKAIPIVGLKPERLREIGWAASTIARGEGLTGHAQAIEIRLRALEGEEKQ